MPSSSGKEPTPRELEILKVLWDQGASSVRGVYQQMLSTEPELAYNTVQTLLRIMETKGLVSHVLNGRTFVYSAHLSRDDAAQRFVTRVFDGVASQLVHSLLRREQIPTAELDRMQAMIDAARQRNQEQRKP